MNIPNGFKLVPDVDALAQFIRKVDGDNRMGAATLAEHVAEWLELDAQPIYDDVVDASVNAVVFGAQNLNSAMETIDTLRAQLAERDALLTDLGVEPDGVSDVYQRLLLNAERYEYLREHMVVENFPSEHPVWSQPSEYESRRIDWLCDSAMCRAKAGEAGHE